MQSCYLGNLGISTYGNQIDTIDKTVFISIFTKVTKL